MKNVGLRAGFVRASTHFHPTAARARSRSLLLTRAERSQRRRHARGHRPLRRLWCRPAWGREGLSPTSG